MVGIYLVPFAFPAKNPFFEPVPLPLCMTKNHEILIGFRPNQGNRSIFQSDNHSWNAHKPSLLFQQMPGGSDPAGPSPLFESRSIVLKFITDDTSEREGFNVSWSPAVGGGIGWRASQWGHFRKGGGIGWRASQWGHLRKGGLGLKEFFWT